MTTLVIGSSGMARSIGDRLLAGGRSPVLLADGTVLDDPSTAAGALRAAVGDAQVDLVVFAELDAAGFLTAPITSLTEQQWDEACERPLRRAVVALQQVHALVGDGTAVVLVLPNVGAVGVAGLVPLCSAVEGIRVLAKSAARRWGARAITVNTIEVELAAFMLGETADEVEGEPRVPVPEVPVLGSPALAASSIVEDVLGLIELLAAPAGRAVTGAFLMADRGTVMLP
jgi:3-oxoacyl-[acyl-carrier protein] reductase